MKNSNAYKWAGQCLRKKRLKEDWANNIINKAKAEGTILYKYLCNYCWGWHVTKDKKNTERMT